MHTCTPCTLGGGARSLAGYLLWLIRARGSVRVKVRNVCGDADARADAALAFFFSAAGFCTRRVEIIYCLFFVYGRMALQPLYSRALLKAC